MAALSAEKKVSGSWRESELSLKEVVRRHPNVSPFVILKTDLRRRGAKLTDAARKNIDPDRDAVFTRGIYGENHAERPNGLTLRDGTTVVGGVERMSEFHGGVDPYIIDLVDGKTVLVDEGEVIEEVSFWPKPDYYDKFTSSGKPMWQILVARPQRMDINIYQFCDFWKEQGGGCKFCPIASAYNESKDIKSKFLDVEDVAEAVAEAIKQPGRFRMIQFCAGSLLSGHELLDDEVDLYVKLLKRLGELFHSKKVMTQLISTASNERQLRRVHDETILTGYTADIEVLTEDLFNWICPGKARHIGYKGWRDSLYKAVEIFGPGAVNTGVVSGVEFAAPHGFSSEEEALEAYLAESEELAKHGVGIAQTIFRPEPGSVFHNQKSPSLEYLVAYAEGLDALQRKYKLEAYFDDYRTCGNHPNTDLARI
jgi:hypothetical protein